MAMALLVGGPSWVAAEEIVPLDFHENGITEKAEDLQVALQISGRVTSEGDNESLPGVTVVEKGTNNGTVTNLNGEYSLEVTDGNPDDRSKCLAE